MFVEFEFRGKTKKLLPFIVELFTEYYLKQEFKDDTEENVTMSENDSQRSDNNTAAEIVDKVSTEKKEKEKLGLSPAKSNLKQTEDHIITSYLAIFVGCACKDHEDNRELVKKELPEGTFISLIIALKAFVLYQSQARLLTKETYDSLSAILNDLEKDQKQ